MEKEMIDLKIKDKYELNALHKALMEAKFNDNPELIIQNSPMVANVMNKVVDELEKVNWVTKAEKKYKKIEWKNTWGKWRENPPESIIVKTIGLHIDFIEKEEHGNKIEYIKILIAPYKLSTKKLGKLLKITKEEHP